MSAEYNRLQTTRSGFFVIENDAFDFLSSRLGFMAWAVYTALCRFAAPGNTCNPSVATIARRLGVSRQTVHIALNRLEEYRVIRREHRFREDGGQDSNLYIITPMRELLPAKTDQHEGDDEPEPTPEPEHAPEPAPEPQAALESAPEPADEFKLKFGDVEQLKLFGRKKRKQAKTGTTRARTANYYSEVVRVLTNAGLNVEASVVVSCLPFWKKAREGMPDLNIPGKDAEALEKEFLELRQVVPSLGLRQYLANPEGARLQAEIRRERAQRAPQVQPVPEPTAASAGSPASHRLYRPPEQDEPPASPESIKAILDETRRKLAAQGGNA